jgi:hypothetical protein
MVSQAGFVEDVTKFLTAPKESNYEIVALAHNHRMFANSFLVQISFRGGASAGNVRRGKCSKVHIARPAGDAKWQQG